MRVLGPAFKTLDPRSVAPERKVADPFYKTAAWRQARGECLLRYCNRCAQCGVGGVRLFVDHKVELRDGGDPLSQDNLWPLCGACHTLKTAREREARMLR